MTQVTALQPLIQLLQNPGKQKDKYLPTMPEDFLPDAKAVLGNTFYECPNGHPYYISECGRPWVESTCPICHLPIGGRSHVLTSTNREARTVDTTQTGHCLGDPHHRSSTPSSERELPPAAVCVVRALMHSVLVWTSCRTQKITEGLLQLVTSGSVQPRGLSEFFWRHLEKDLELLCRALSKNMQEAVLVLHLVIKRMGSFTTHFQKTSLTSRQDRVAWECNFNTTYIQPIMENVDRELDIAMKMILKDAKAVNNQLLYVVYERMESASGLLDPHLWTFRTRITLDHLSLTLQQKGIQECPILLRFLKEEPDLRATQYIPDVVKLQQKLYDQFDRTLDKTEAVKTTFKMFLRGLSSVTTRERYQRLFRSVQKAWALVKNKLQYHTRFRVSQEFILPALTEDVPLEYLIPTTAGAGACTTALVDFLMYTHNNFIEWCMSTDASSKSFWQEHKVPLTRVHGCHLLDYKGQIIPIVLAHCKYSLRLGEGQSVTYDLPALEKHFLNRFIYGKPLILSDIPQVQYKKDVYSSGNFAVIRKKVSPQTPLPFQIQVEILSDLRSLSRLKETLDVVDIVLGFLSSGGGKAEKNLGDYLDHTLRMSKRRFSTKAKQLCTLGNILSLWKTLAVALAKQLMLSEQEPFDHISDGNGPPEGLDLQLKQVLDHSLPSFDLDQLLGIFYEFIQTYGRYASPEQKSWPLKDTLIAYLEESDMPLPAALEDHFPDDITVAQAVDTWKHIVHYQQQTTQ